MKKFNITALVLIGLMSSSSLLAQSKKQQIVTLTALVDSFRSALNNQIDETNKLKMEISNLKSSFNQKSTDYNKLLGEKRDLGKTVADLKSDIKIQKSELDNKSDSIAALKLTQAPIPENNYPIMAKSFTQETVNTKQVTMWLKLTSENDLFTQNCKAYITDATAVYQGFDGSITEADFNQKWEDDFNINYSQFGHAFQNGNCGWVSKNFSSVTYLGDLNNGQWFKVEVTGGCSEGDTSQKLVRIIKVIKENGTYKIDNFLSISDGK